ncbi:hypothetical protein FE784_00695 [Paenibacillus hemerocallicola]|uniref:Uncharacterized protein n=1 Tax=Paenibacillus hemerocallicola TaxID=1172614 RepID=A0A5C4TIW5_9BACL|nr:hypothetical protein [Paenibacillus hemerocallicola]TNJ68390.1 hypothetical protein FE784_00695 [Paenibacillus hemerocallicola]
MTKQNDDLLLEHEIQVVRGIMESREQYRKVVKAAIARWVKDFQEDRIEMNTVDDLRKLIEMDIELQKGEL